MFSSVQSSCSVLSVWSFATPWTAAWQAYMSVESVMPSDYLILHRPLLLLPSIFPSIRVFSSESVLHIRWPKYWSFIFRISPSNEYLWLISSGFTVWSPCSPRDSQESSSKPQFKSINFSVFSFHYSPTLISNMTIGKTIALTRLTFVDKVMSLSRLILAFLPKSKCLLISWLQSSSAVILEPKKKKIWHCFHCFPIYLPWSDGTGCHDLSFLNVDF